MLVGRKPREDKMFLNRLAELYAQPKELAKDLITIFAVLVCAFGNLYASQTTWMVMLATFGPAAIIAFLIGMWDGLAPDGARGKITLEDRMIIRYAIPFSLVVVVASIFSMMPSTQSVSGRILNAYQAAILFRGGFMGSFMIINVSFLGACIASKMQESVET
jgi:hypothetical protein